MRLLRINLCWVTIVQCDLMFTLFSSKHALSLFADDLPRRRPPQIYKPPTAEMIAYLDFSVSTTGMLTGVKVRLWRIRIVLLIPIQYQQAIKCTAAELQCVFSSIHWILES